MSRALTMAFTKCPQITPLQVGIHKQTLHPTQEGIKICQMFM